MEYTEFLDQRLKDYRLRYANDDFIEPGEPFLELDWTQDNRSYFRDLVSHKIVTRADVTKALATAKRHAAIRDALGSVPSTPLEFAALYMAKVEAKVTFKGTIAVPGYMCPSILDIQRDARLMAGEIGITFAVPAINDAIEKAYINAKDAALDRIRTSIDQRGEFDWQRLVDGCFAPDHREIVIAALRKFIWQVKRKMHGLPITNHLMPVIVGGQGSGKSYFVKKLTAPLSDVTSYSDFAAITDDRNIDLWRSFVIVMDEMARAGKADIETTKHVITADYIERRPMRTNTTVTVMNNATMIGTSNVTLAELIRDDTGNRRFFEALWANPEFGFLDTFDFLAAWHSVHESEADPMADYYAELASVQEQSRTQGPIEAWLSDLDNPGWQALHDLSNRQDFIRSQELFDKYLEHRQRVNGGTEREHRSLQAFVRELKRISSQRDVGIEPMRTKHANGFRVTKNILSLEVL